MSLIKKIKSLTDEGFEKDASNIFMQYAFDEDNRNPILLDFISNAIKRGYNIKIEQDDETNLKYGHRILFVEASFDKQEG